ncbi:MAG: DUF2520 domain-containing protein [Actinobacteria bacterium]|nr:DUF2520 domain-containing protein [Actinomycetota bacterium]
MTPPARLGRRRVAVLGPGRVGTLLATALTRAGHRVVAVAGGSDDARARFTGALAGARTHASVADAARDADLVLVSTPDDAIAAVVSELAVAEAVGEGDLVVHLAGAHGLAPLRRAALAGAGVAACHPAQTMPAGEGPPDPDAIVGAAWAVTAAPADRSWAHELVVQLGGEPHDVADADRGLYHAALAVGSNAVAAATALARQLLLGARVEDPAAFLGPLAAASTANVLRDGAVAITGPVARGDLGTIETHLAILDRDLPHLADDYRRLTRVVLDQVRPSLPADRADAIARVLGTRS